MALVSRVPANPAEGLRRYVGPTFRRPERSTWNASSSSATRAQPGLKAVHAHHSGAGMLASPGRGGDGRRPYTVRLHASCWPSLVAFSRIVATEDEPRRRCRVNVVRSASHTLTVRAFA